MSVAEVVVTSLAVLVVTDGGVLMVVKVKSVPLPVPWSPVALALKWYMVPGDRLERSK